MKTNVIKKAVSVLACASILAGCTAMSNAAGGTGDPQYWFGLYSKTVNLDVASKKSKDMFTYRNNDYDYFMYKYSVSYIHYSGLATGAYLSNLKVKVSSRYVCEVNTPKRWGPYLAPNPGNQKFVLDNGAKKDVGIKMTFSIGEYY